MLHREIKKNFDNLKKETVVSIEEFFRYSNKGMYVLRNQVASNYNESITMKGFSLEDDGLYLIGENDDGMELHEENLSECNIDDLIYCLGELERKAYDYQAN
jgi:hypothetical protein